MSDTGTRRVRKNNRFNLGSKRLKNAQLHDEIMRPSGDWGVSPQQAAYVLWGVQMHCLLLLFYYYCFNAIKALAKVCKVAHT